MLSIWFACPFVEKYSSFVISLRRKFERHLGPAWAGRAALGESGAMTMGYSVVGPGDRYDWDGLRRPDTVGPPVWLYQCTLLGQGIFESGGSVRAVQPGEAFCAVIPSRHRYHSDPQCPRWVFFWMLLRHSEIVPRLLRHENLVNTIIGSQTGEEVATLAAQVLLRTDLHEDPLEVEGGLFRWMLALERLAVRQRHPDAEREKMRQFVRTFLLADLRKFIGVEEIAAAWGADRASFTRKFGEATGESPAAFVRRVRLGEAIRLLSNPALSVKEVAARTGFADANHFCKTFRAEMRMSPGSYRRMVVPAAD
jgi:AraC-like DNA-binding protein